MGLIGLILLGMTGCATFTLTRVVTPVGTVQVDVSPPGWWGGWWTVETPEPGTVECSEPNLVVSEEE